MYIYSHKNQLFYKNRPYFRPFYNVSSHSFVYLKSPLFYVCTALFISPFFRYVRHILGVVEYSTVGQIQSCVFLGILSFALCFGLSFILGRLDQKYRFTASIFGSKFFQKWISGGLAIENFLRSPQNCYFFGVLFGIYLLLLFWVLFYGYSFSFKETPYVVLGGRFFGTVLCISVTVYIKFRSSYISHSALGLKPMEKITSWSLLRTLGFYRPITKRPILKYSHTANKVYTNCTALFEKKGVAGYIEGVYNFIPHLRKFILGVASTFWAYWISCIFSYSIDGPGGLRNIVYRSLRAKIGSKERYVKRPERPVHLEYRIQREMGEVYENIHDKLAFYSKFKDPSFRRDEIESRIQCYIDEQIALSLKSISICQKVKNEVSDKSLLYFLYPKNYIKLRKMAKMCGRNKASDDFDIGIEKLWNS